MSVTSTESAALHKALTGFPSIVSNWSGGAWSWDTRFNCPTAIVEGDERESTLAFLRRELPNVYDHTTRASLPGSVAEMVEATGGLRPGQCVIADDGRDGVYRFALWWPWTNGVTVSIRLATTT